MEKRKINWVKNVKTVSTFPPERTFTKSAKEIAQIMSRREVSPKRAWLRDKDDTILYQSLWQESSGEQKKGS